MNILVLQLKRIGDLVLTTPALGALRRMFPKARITLVADEACKSLLPALPVVDEGLIYSRTVSNRDVWKCVRRGGWDVCLDFTGTDRSALMTWLSGAKRCITYEWVRKHWFRRLAYSEFVDSPVRTSHTVDHYLDLIRAFGQVDETAPFPEMQISREDFLAMQSHIELWIPDPLPSNYVLVHPGSARPEKYWITERWAEVIFEYAKKGVHCILSCGPDPFERAHMKEICALIDEKLMASNRQDELLGAPSRTGNSYVFAQDVYPIRLISLVALVRNARLVLSCDTAVVHFAAALRKPQVALFGPTNPFHWRPRHEQAVVISAAQPDAPLTNFEPKMKGAAMECIPVETVLRAAEGLLK